MGWVIWKGGKNPLQQSVRLKSDWGKSIWEWQIWDKQNKTKCNIETCVLESTLKLIYGSSHPSIEERKVAFFLLWRLIKDECVFKQMSEYYTAECCPPCVSRHQFITLRPFFEECCAHNEENFLKKSSGIWEGCVLVFVGVFLNPVCKMGLD